MTGIVSMMTVLVELLAHLVLDRLLQSATCSFAGDLFQGDTNDRLGCQPQGNSR
jgi:hypothetical protein